MPDLQETVLNAHRQMEHFTHRWLQGYQAAGGVVHCTRGCANCCHMAVHSTFPEAVMVAGELTPSQLARLDLYIDKLTALTDELSSMPDYLKKHRERLSGCPFLVDAACDIYPLRPLACRSLLSTKPADWCAVDLAKLDPWDRQLYEQSLDLQTVAWPTHYVAACQDFGRNLEQELLAKMLEQCGWSLSGNFPLMVWLAKRHQIDGKLACDVDEVLAQLPFTHRYLLVLQTASK